MDQNPAAPVSRPGAKLRIVGVCILVLGLGAAAAIYFLQTPALDVSDDVSTPQTSKAQARAIEMQVGKMGVLAEDFMENYQDPAVQAAAVALVSIFAAGGCFYIAHLIARRDRLSPPP